MTDPSPTVPLDRHGRALRNLRISVTDRCNLRCNYCMPEDDYIWLPREQILSFEELSRLVDAFLTLGVTKIRLTGGEPLLRRGLEEFVAELAAKPGLVDLALTTNGLKLADQAEGLRRAGLQRVTISLDTLRPERYREMTRRDEHGAVLEGIEAAAAAGLHPVKLNTVLMQGVNDDELAPLVEFARAGGHELRFIEYMDVGGATRWAAARVVTRDEILRAVAQRCGPPTPFSPADPAPAERYRLPDGTVFGIVASTSAPFCSSCDRSRLTADGKFFTCLYAREGLDLARPLRGGASGDELARILRRRWIEREDRGAEERLRLAEGSRAALAQAEDLRGNPHLEMHTRGG